MGRVGKLEPEQSELRELFADGLAAYRQQDWDEAQAHFESCLRTGGKSPPSSGSAGRDAYAVRCGLQKKNGLTLFTPARSNQRR